MKFLPKLVLVGLIGFLPACVAKTSAEPQSMPPDPKEQYRVELPNSKCDVLWYGKRDGSFIHFDCYTTHAIFAMEEFEQNHSAWKLVDIEQVSIGSRWEGYRARTKNIE